MHKVARNTAIVILGKAINSLLVMLIAILLARSLGAESFGVYSFVFAYLGFFNILADLGIKTILVREISRDKAQAENLAGNAIIMRITLSIFALLSACLVISFLQYPLTTKFLVYIGSLSILTSLTLLYEAIFQVNFKMEYAIGVNILDSLFKLSLFCVLIIFKVSLSWFIAASIFASMPGLFIIIKLSRRFVRPIFKLDFRIWKGLVCESWPLALTAAFIMLYMRIDQIMLFQMKGAKAVGYYAAAVGLAEAFNILPAAFMISIFPLLSKYFITSKTKLEKTYKLSFKYLAIVIVPIVVGIFILSEPIIRIIYGMQFLPVIPSLKILIWSEIFAFLGVVYFYILTSLGLQKINFIFTLASATLNIILNFLLIPAYDINGAAIATVISYSFSVLLSCILPITRQYGQALVSSTLKPFIAAGFMGIFTYSAFMFRVPLAVIIPVSTILYFISLILIKGLNTQDKEYFEKIFLYR